MSGGIVFNFHAIKPSSCNLQLRGGIASKACQPMQRELEVPIALDLTGQSAAENGLV